MSMVNVYEMLGCKAPKRNALDLPSTFRMAMISPSGGGKSSTLINMIDEIEADFDHVIFVVKTKEEPLYKELRDHLNNPEWLQFVDETPPVEQIPPKTLIVLDDQILDKGRHSNYANNLKLFVYGRKANATKKDPAGASVVFLSQNYGEIDQTIKKNLNVIMFHNPQASDLLMLKRDLELGSKERAKAIFDLSKQKGRWVCVDKEEAVDSPKRLFIFE